MPSLFTLCTFVRFAVGIERAKKKEKKRLGGGGIPFESMAAVAVLVSPSYWGAVVAEVHQSCVVSSHLSVCES